MAIQEQAVLKMGLDVRDVEESARRATRAIQETGEHSHKSFVHAGSAAKGFHKVMESITEQSPLLGRALQFAISPVAAAFTLAAVAIEHFREKEKEVIEQSLKLGEAAAKPMGDAKQGAADAAKAVRDLKYEYEKWEHGLKNALQEEERQKQLKESLIKLDEKAAAAVKAGANAQDTERTRLQLKYKMEQDALQATATERAKTTEEIKKQEGELEKQAANKAMRAERAKGAIEAETEIQAQAQEKIKKANEEMAKGPGWKDIWEFGPFAANEMFDRKQQAKIDAAKQELEASKARVRLQKEAGDKDDENFRRAKDRLSELQAKRGKLTGQFEGLDEQSAQTLKALRILPPIPGTRMNQPTIDAGKAVSDIDLKWRDYLKSNQTTMTQWYRDHGIDVGGQQPMVGFSGKTAASEVERLLQEILNRYNSGIAVFGKE